MAGGSFGILDRMNVGAVSANRWERAGLAALLAGTALAYLLYFWLIHHVGATRTALVTYLLPCTALIWGALFLHESVSWNAVAGLALVLLGAMVTNGTLDGLAARLSGRGNKTKVERGVRVEAKVEAKVEATVEAASPKGAR